MEPQNSVQLASKDNTYSYGLSVTQTGVDTATLEVREWSLGADPTSAPSSDHSFNLTNARSAGGIVTCQTRVFFQTADVTITLSGAGQPPSAAIAVTHLMIGNSNKTYPLSPADHAALAKFDADAKFPAL